MMLQRFEKTLFLFLIWVFTLLFSVNPGYPAAPDSDAFEKALSLINSGRYFEAVSLYQSLYDDLSVREDTRAQALFFIGSMYAQYLDLPDKALACFNELLKDFPESRSAPDALFNSGSILYKSGRYEDSRNTFRKYLKRYPDDMRRQSAKAWADSAGKHLSSDGSGINLYSVLPPLSPEVRVKIFNNLSAVTIKSTSALAVKDLRTGGTHLETENDLTFRLRRGILLINGHPFSFRECRVSSKGKSINVQGRKFRGQIRVLIKKTGLMVINDLSIEEYLYGVVPKEMSWLWSPEALKAQAIASRTYALYIRDKQSLSPSDYDLESTTSSQVYGGLDAEKEPTRIAVDQTRGMVMTYQGCLIIAYFHSNSGGYTESASNVWGVDVPYLKSIPDDFSTILPDANWEYAISFADVNKRLKSETHGLGAINAIQPGRKSQSGRILTFTLNSGKKQKTVSGNALRMALGPRELKSTLFDIEQNRTGFHFKGVGYGHGVGMSQWGAHRMAQAGYRFDAILKYYYKGVDIDRVKYL